ncbi:hypothetical protein L596_007465 [Steinernema carpocapsae]|uniref:Uncharacterized protein n=1 Tax=Steinernema carpocapsae TaxID=34508 RepID=A0A4U5P9C5_STECR|nr:hypothetical protein L596_007465 [Steinernema carpocapsae]
MDSDPDPQSSSSESPRTGDASAAPSISSSIVTDIDVSEDGILDASNRELTKLPQPKNASTLVRVLNVAGNCLKSFEGIRKFVGCEEIDASDNRIQSIAALLCIKETLTVLNVQKNSIQHCEHICAFHALVELDLARNSTLQLPVLHSLPNLRSLNLSGNELTKLPVLRQLENLIVLKLNSNKIETLEGVQSCLPPHLKSLDVGRNKIGDLSDVAYLKGFLEISSLTFEGNPAVSIQGRSFCYRPYLASCLPESLKIVDDFVLSEMEIVKGEWLCTQGNAAKYKPGTKCHAALCEYLSNVLDPTSSANTTLRSPLEDKLLKIIKQRRKFEEERANTTTSDFTSISEIESPLTSGRRPVLERRLSTASDASNSTVVVSSSHNSVIIAGGQKTPVPYILSRQARTPASQISARKQPETPASQSAPRLSKTPVLLAASRQSRTPSSQVSSRLFKTPVPPITVKVSERLEGLEQGMKDLVEENNRLTLINAEQTELIQQLLEMKNDCMAEISMLREEKSQEIKALNAKLESLEKRMTTANLTHPKPSFLRLINENGRPLLIWHNLPSVDSALIAHYNVFVNGDICGSAKAAKCRIHLTDTQPGDRIAVELVSTTGAKSISDVFTCPAKENVTP